MIANYPDTCREKVPIAPLYALKRILKIILLAVSIGIICIVLLRLALNN